MTIEPIAYIHTDFPAKFGIPRQSGLIPSLEADIVFEPEYRRSEAVRGLESCSHIWLIWEFSAAVREKWLPTVRPPRLGGNQSMGVFATRSPFRPNPLGLSSVELKEIIYDERGPVLKVKGADLMHLTPIYDIKPYIKYTDCHAEAKAPCFDALPEGNLQVLFEEALLQRVEPHKREPLIDVLRHDPRPRYQDSPDKVYGVSFAGLNIRFKVADECLTVTNVQKL